MGLVSTPLPLFRNYRMAMDEKIFQELSQETPTAFHVAILTKCKNLAKMSRDNMSQYYNKWDRYNCVYRGLVQPDADDLKARERKEPEKMVIPIAFAQVQTFVSFAMVMLLQRPNFFEVDGVGDEDYSSAKAVESLLQRDLDMSQWQKLLYQYLLDVARYGLGIFKHGWVVETKKQMVESQMEVPSVADAPPSVVTTMEEVEVPVFEGNRIWTVPPYRFLPDVRLPLSRFEEGEFCGSEDEYSLTSLKQMESEKMVAGVKYIPAFTKDVLQERNTSRWQFAEKIDTVTAGKEGNKQSVLITEMEVALIPSEFKIGSGTTFGGAQGGDVNNVSMGRDSGSGGGQANSNVDNKGDVLGPETYPVKYKVWYANDVRVIRCEPCGYEHNKWGYDLGEWSPDQVQLVNEGISGTIDPLQEAISWMLNTRIASVRKVVDDRMVVDPWGIEPQDIRDRNPILRLRQGAYRTGVDKYVRQLNVQDVTGNHVKDAMSLKQVVQEVTGMSDNAMGNYASGRRSSFEAKTVNSGSAMRVKAPLLVMFATTFRPMGLKLISNLRQGITQETYVKVFGEKANPHDFQMIKVGPEELAGAYDFEMLDTTLPSERTYQASGLQELLLGMIQNPEAAQIFGFTPTDLRGMMETIMDLRGIKLPPKVPLPPEMQPNLPAGQVGPDSAQIKASNGKSPSYSQTQPPARPGFNLSNGAPQVPTQLDSLGDQLNNLIGGTR